MANLVLNRIKTPDGTILTSYHRYHFVAHIDANGLRYFVDGGNEYLRRCFHRSCPYEELSIYDNDHFEIVRKSFHWGTYGKLGNQPLQWVPLRELETEHIEAILQTQKQRLENRRALFKKELAYRKNNEV